MKLHAASGWWKCIAGATLLIASVLGAQSTTHAAKTMSVRIIPVSSGLEDAVTYCRAGVAGAAQRHGYQLVPLGSPGPVLHIIIDVLNVYRTSTYGNDNGYDRYVRVATGGWELDEKESKFSGMILASTTKENAHMDVVCVGIVNALFGDK